ncbi:hypothetical protein CBR_g31094 [Chara braunii]|uniref:Reverse transcriptase domain-containing protein n=1 Tax=Chara braunii TaxID=69332 RepID=A0A388LEA5_CHABU|nr:hypothetical protein CBR_g31094 [Chara braunii]|eukprot:GBG80634.1 hypothetical protein CBR_g31094 [Chara braunii]
MLLRSQTVVMDQKSTETDEAYQARMLLLITEAKQQSDAVAAAAKKKAEDAEKARLLAIEQQHQQDEAATKVADEERLQRREKIFSGERALLTMEVDWRAEDDNGKLEESGNKIALLLSHLTDLLATCIAQPEDIHHLNNAVHTHNQVFDQLTSRLQQLEQTVAALIASSSNTFDRLEALEIDIGSLKDGVQLQQNATQQFEQRICTAATYSRSKSRETTPKFDDQEIFCDSTKTDPIPWFHKFELKLQLHYVSEHKHHVYLHSRSGGACQAWLDNLLSKYGVVAVDLHTKISRDDLKAAWHKRFQVELSEIKAMDKLMTFEQGTLPSVDWIAEYQRLTSLPDIQMGFKDVKHYFISRSCPALGNALTHVEDTLTTTAELFDKVAQIIVTNKEAKNLHRSSATGLTRDQHRPKVAVVVVATPTDQTGEALSANEGDRLAAARDGGPPGKGRGRDVRHFGHGLRRYFGNALACKCGSQGQLQPADSYRPRRFRHRSVVHYSSSAPFDPMPSGDGQVVPGYLRLHNEIGLCFLRTVTVADSSPTNLSSNPRVVRLLEEFTDIFESPTGVVPDRPISHEIILEVGAVPPKGCIYHMSEEELKVLRAQLDDLLDKGWIRPSSSPYRAPVLFVRKKNKDLQLCIDYHKLNAQTVKNAGPLPHIDDLLERLGGTK